MAKKRLPPVVKGYPLVGNLFDALRDPLEFMLRELPKYGDVVRARVGPLEIYIVSHPNDVEYVLHGNHRNFIKDKGTRTVLAEVLGQGLVTSEGDLWRRQRRLAQPAFQLDQVQKYSIDGGLCRGDAQGLAARRKPEYARSDMMRLTLEIVAQTLFTASVGDKAASVGTAMEALMTYSAGPGGLFRWWKYVPTPTTLRFRRAARDLDSMILEAVAERRSGGSGSEDLLARYLRTRDDDGSQMSDKQLRDEMMTLLLAGHETTAVALTFCFYLLALHPEADARLAAELDEVLAGEPPTVEHISRLRYTEWVVKEAMRPLSAGAKRQSRGDRGLRNRRLPHTQGSGKIAVVQWMTHRDKRLVW